MLTRFRTQADGCTNGPSGIRKSIYLVNPIILMYIFVSLFRLGFGVGSMRICENLGLGKRLGFIDDFRYPSASARN